MNTRNYSKLPSPKVKRNLRMFVKDLNPEKIKKNYYYKDENYTKTCNEIIIGHERLNKN